MCKKAFVALSFMLAAVAGIVVTFHPAGAQERVNVRLDFRGVGYHVPFYWAKAKGYYEKEGLIVDLKEGSSSGQTINLVNSKEADIGLADLMLMANAVSKGMQIKAVYGLIQINPWAVISNADSAIRKPQDLQGRSVALTADHRVLLEVLLRNNKVSPDKITIRVVNVATRNTVFAEGKVDSFVSVIMGTPTDLVVLAQQGKGKPLHFMRFSEFGVSPLGGGFMVHKDYLAKNPETIRKFLRATNRGIEDTLKESNWKEGFDILLRETNAAPERRASLQLQWEYAVKLLQTEHTRGKPLGWMSRADWNVTIDLLKSMGIVTTPLSPDDTYTNDLISAP